ncbi:MAG: hypothetical protein KAI94_09475, partial [Anaerolineales bacterium]|nr:hypothetical protein [Anaerolineales bacterium]
YAFISYWTAYLKANYPTHFMASLLTSVMGQSEKVSTAVAECQRLGLKVEMPDINRSSDGFTVGEDGVTIHFGLAAIKNVGAAAVRSIVTAREQGGPFESIVDLCQRVDIGSINKRMLESMIKAGAFDSLGSRGALLANVDRIISTSQREQRLKEKGQSTMFDLWGSSVDAPVAEMELGNYDVPSKEKLVWEKELLGAYLSDHPYSHAAKRLQSEVNALCGDINPDWAGQNVITAGQVASVRRSVTKDGRPFVSAMIEDLYGTIEVTAWASVYQTTKELWEEGNILIIEGKVRTRNDRVQLNCQAVREYNPQEGSDQTEEADELKARRLIIRLSESDDEDADIERLQDIVHVLKQHLGQDDVQLVVGGNRVQFPGLSVVYSDELRNKLLALVGDGGVEVLEF